LYHNCIIFIDFQKIIKNSPPLKFNLKLYRGEKKDYYQNFKERRQKVYSKIKQFSSATIDVSVAPKYTEGNCCLLQILVLKGTNILYNNNVSVYPEDHEVNININSVYLVQENSTLEINGESYITTNIVIVK
jgi:hypothetical protein